MMPGGALMTYCLQGLWLEFSSPRWTNPKRLSRHHLPQFEIRVFLLLGTVCLWHLLYPVLPCWSFWGRSSVHNLRMWVLTVVPQQVSNCHSSDHHQIWKTQKCLCVHEFIIVVAWFITNITSQRMVFWHLALCFVDNYLTNVCNH